MIWPVLLAILPLLFDGKDPGSYAKVPAPGVRYRMNMATATRAPWIDSNLSRYRRNPQANFLCDVHDKPVALAMAEANAAGAHVFLQTTPAQRGDFEAMTVFLKSLPDGPMTPWANITITDDGSPVAEEVFLLLTRRNMFYRIAPRDAASALHLNLNARIPNVYDFVLDARDKLGDDRRSLRLFGSELTIAYPAREGKKVRVHLINYGSRPVQSLRLRVEGKYTSSQAGAHVFRDASPKLTDFEQDGRFTEFTLENLPLYAVLDLTDLS